MATGSNKRERIGARVPPEVYATLVRAADLMNMTVNQFMVQSALKEACAVIENGKPSAFPPRQPAPA